MNLEELKQRHMQLSAQRKHFESQFMMLNGHIAEVEYHIALLENPPLEPVPEQEVHDGQADQQAEEQAA